MRIPQRSGQKPYNGKKNRTSFRLCTVVYVFFLFETEPFHFPDWYRQTSNTIFLKKRNYHEHVLRATMGIFRAAGYSSIIKSVPTSDGYRRADLHVVGAHLMGKDDLVVDVTVRHDFIGDARDVLRHGTLRNPHRPHQLLDQAAADKIRNYREPYARSVAAVSACVHACLPRGAFTASFCGCSTSLRPGKHLTT